MSLPAVVPFSFESHEVRVLDRDGDPWFVLADVCRVLEISNPSDVASRLDSDEKETLDNAEGFRGAPIIISEPGLYKLIDLAVLAIGAITVATPRLRSVMQPLPPAGWVCRRVERSTAAGSERSTRCEPEEGWHVEEWPSVGRVAVPDYAMVLRRHVAGD